MTVSFTTARDIKPSVSRSPPTSVSTSPTTPFQSLSFHSSSSSPYASRNGNGYLPHYQPFEKQLKPFATEDIKILLLENINESARDVLKKQGYQVEYYSHALSEEELVEKIKSVPLL